MALHSFVMAAMLLSCALTVLAYLQPEDLKEAQRTYSRALSGVVQQDLVLTNITNAATVPPAPIGSIECFRDGQGRMATDVDGCRPTLNHFRTFLNYRRLQDFIEGQCPKSPSKPPYAVHHLQSNCAVQIASGNPNIRDDFSFEQARALATEILEECQDRGGRGGFAPIGHGVGWRVAVIGFKLPPDPPYSTGLLEDDGSGNGTSGPIEIVKD